METARRLLAIAGGCCWWLQAVVGSGRQMQANAPSWQAVAGSCRQLQAVAGSCRQLQAVAGSCRQLLLKRARAPISSGDCSQWRQWSRVDCSHRNNHPRIASKIFVRGVPFFYFFSFSVFFTRYSITTVILQVYSSASQPSTHCHVYYQRARMPLWALSFPPSRRGRTNLSPVMAEQLTR